MFDDLIPGNRPAAGMFDDLIPPAKRNGKGRSDPSSALLTDADVFGDEVLTDEEVFGPANRQPLPTGMKPSNAGAGRGKVPGKTAEQEAELASQAQADAASQRARRGTMRATPAYGAGGDVDRAALRFEPSNAGAGRGNVVEKPGERVAYTSGSQPYQDKREAIDDAVDRIALGAPAEKVFGQFKALGVTPQEIQARGAELGTKGFVPDTRPVTVRPGALSGTMAPNEPTTAQGVANFGRRVAARSSQAFTGALASAGVIGPDQAAPALARDEKRLQAAAVGEELQRQLEELGKVKEWGQVGPAIANNLRGTAVMLAESVAMSAPALAATVLGLPRVALAGAVGVSSGSLEYGSALSDALTDRGVTLLDVDKVSALLKDDRFMADVRERAAKRGLAVGAVDALTAGIAGSFIEPALAAVRAGEAAGRAAVRTLAAGAIKELGTQVAGGAGGEALAQKLTGENKPLDIALEALAEGVSAPMEARSNILAGRQAEELGSPAGQFAGALAADIAERGAPRQAPIRGTAAQASGPALAEPTVMPRAPRVEEMPTTPFTPEQTAAMAAEAQARRLARDLAEQSDGELSAAPPPAAAPSSMTPKTTERAGADRTRQPAAPGARGEQDRAGAALPGQLPRGSLVDEARRRVAQQTPPSDPAAAAPAGAAAPATGWVDESSGTRQPAARQAARQVAPADGQPDGAGATQPQTKPAASGGGTSAPAPSPAPADTFASRDAALVAAVQRGQWQRLEPVQESDGTWRLVERQQPAEQRSTASPLNAASPAPESATTDAGALSTGSTATGQAGQKQDARPTAGIAPTPGRPEAPIREVDLQQAATAAVSGAAHADPGQPAEPASAAVVQQAVTTGARHAERRPAELRADLLAQIDRALADAPAGEDLPEWRTPTKARLRQVMVDLRLSSLERAEQALRQAHDNRVADASQRIGFVTFRVEGDGEFKVLNSAARLADFRRMVEKSAGFKAQRLASAPELDGAQRGSASTKAAIEAMLDENDPQAAVDFAAAKAVDIAELGLSPSRLAKLAGVTPTTLVDEQPATQDSAQPASDASGSDQPGGALAADAEALAPSAAADALAVRPAEMTQDEFIRGTTFARDGNSANPWTARWRGVQLEADAAGFDHPDLGKTVAAGARFFPTRRAAEAAARSAHRRAVQRALRAGEPVADAVLQPYLAQLIGQQEPLADLLGIDRRELAGLPVKAQAVIAENGQAVEVSFPDSLKALQELDRQWQALQRGVVDSSSRERFDALVAEKQAAKVDPLEARRAAALALFDELRRDSRWLQEAIRAQHGSLFPGQAGPAPAGSSTGPSAEADALRGLVVTVDAADKDGQVRPMRVRAGDAVASYDARLQALASGANLDSEDGARLSELMASLVLAGDTAPAARTKALDQLADELRAERADFIAEVRRQYPTALRDAEPEQPARQRIADEAGEKIGGSRRDRWAERGLSVADLDAMTEAEGAELVSKAAVWRPDYSAMVAAGSHPKAVAMVKLVVDSLAAKPKDNTPTGRRRYVTAMQAVRQAYGDLAQHGEGLHGIESMARQVLQRAAESLRANLGVRSADPATEREGRAVLFSVYKGRSDPFALGYGTERRAAELVADGFPAKSEPWTRRFEIRDIGGPGITEAGLQSYLKLAESLASPITAEQIRAGAFTVTSKKDRKPLAIAASQADAQAAARTLYGAELQAKDDGKQPERPHLDVLQRDGLPQRIDRDVTPDDLLQTFGFRGTEFGNWTAQDERQRMLNMAFDGLSDLAEILGVQTEALSLNGSLGLAFGARGGGRFAAHYEPGKLVINLTKLQGGGSLAHEWAHALDHYLGELDRPDAYQTAARGASGWYTRRDYTGKPERRMVREGGRWVVRQEQSLANLRPELAAAVDKVMAALYQKALPQAEAVRAAELRVEQLQARRAEVEPTGDAGLLASYDTALQDARRKLAEAQAGMAQGSVPTDFAQQAQKLSGKSADGYWLRPTEMFARAFECYVFDRLVAMGARSQYLVHGVEADRFAGAIFKGNPYPTGEERAAINAAFDDLAKTLQTKRTDRGVALFQRRQPAAQPGDQQAERNALQALSENDDLFVLPRATGMTVEAIAAEIAPAIKVRKTVVSNLETMWRLTMQDGSFALLVERKPNPYGPQPYDFETVGSNEVPVTERPGDNPDDVDPSTVDVFIDASRLNPGGAGAQVYAIAAGYAHNTGKLFIGDPAGLSDEALRRRPEHMLSSALKYGTTRHLAPHPRQVRGDASLGVPPLRWVYGDDLGNIRRLVAVNIEALQNQYPNASQLTFDPATRQFTNSATGATGPAAAQELLPGDDARGAGAGRPVALAGRRTLARGAVLRALVREEGAGLEGTDGRRDGLLARLAGIADDPAAAGIFYSRSGAAARGDTGPVADPQRLRLVRAAVDEITAGWSAAPPIEVLASMQDAPEPVRAANIRQLSQGAQGEPAAFYFDGKVYLLASQMASRRDVAEAVAHEALGHFGLRRTFGAELDKVLNELAALREADVRAKAAEYGLDFADKEQRLEAAEELLAELAQTQPELSLVRRAIAAIRTWLRKNLPGLGELALTDDEIVRSFILPARAYVADGETARGAGRAGAGTTFARQRGDDSDRDAGAMPGFRSWLERAGDEAGASVRFTGEAGGAGAAEAQPSHRGRLPAFIDVDGQQRPTADSTGQPLGVDDEAVRDFWRRFAGSTMVDAQGRPMLLHGATGAQGGFSAVQAGPLGAGVYFRDSQAAAMADGGAGRRAAGSRAPSAGTGYLVLRNPYVFDAAGYEWPAGFTVGGALATLDRPAGPPADPPGSPLAALLDQVLPPAQARTNLLKMARSGGDIGPALRGQLQAMGHDGLVVRFADPAEGEPAYVAFDRGQAIHSWQGAADAPAAAATPAGDANQPSTGKARPPESIEVDGQQRSTRDASGRLIAANADAIRNFWRWFGDSRAVDSAGRPIPLFHGTGKDIDAFVASRSGMLGSGVYITGNAASANEYATTFNEGGEGRVMSVYARLRNPYFFAMPEGWLPDWYDAPLNHEFKHAEDLPWGIKLVADVMPRDSARRIIDRLLREGTINIGAALTDRLKAMGHDGIVAFDGQADPARQPDDTIWTDPKNEVVIFDPKAIKSATGNTGAFAEGTRSIRFQRRPVAAEDQPTQDIALRPFGRAGRIVEVLQDRFNRWKQAIDDVRRQGGTVNDDNDFYRAEERYWGQVGAGIEEFKDQLKAFVKVVANDRLRIEDVALYAYAQHAEERNEWVAARRPDMPDGGSGMKTAEADEILEAARQAGVEAELQRHALTLRRWIQGTRDVLFDGGLIDQEEYDTWIGMFQQYVPLRGTDDDAVAVAGQPAGVRRAKPRGGISGDEAEHAIGRTSQALQIVEQIAHDRARALIRAGRNNVLRTFARFVLDNPAPDLWEINAVERRRSTVVDEDGYSRTQDTEQVISDGRTITLKDAGQEIHILVKDAKLLEQLQRMGVDERPSWAIGALLSANRWLSRVYTSLSPVFTAINAIRDTQAAAIGLIDEIGFLGAPKLFAKLPGAWLESFKAEAGKPSADYQLFRATGGVTHFMNLVTIDKQAQELADIVADAERSLADPRKFLPKAMALIEAVNGGIENATRLAAFKVARESGKTTLQAASIAKNITVNFNRKGTQQLGNAWVLFFNPAVQGTARVAKAMASPKVVATMGVAMLGVAALALRNASMGDDDDGVAWWDKIPDDVKERNIVIVLPPGAKAGEAVPKSKSGRYLKIPMPYGYNFFAVVANQVVDVWRHEQDKRRGRDVVKAGARAFNAFASSWLPAQDLGRMFTADDASTAGKSAVLLAIPDALDPLARIALNQDSFGRPMRPDSRFSENLPDSSNYFAGQHGTLFQRGAAALNQATGGTRYQAGIVDVAPSSFEHLVRSYGGGPVSFGLDIINALYLRQTIARPELDAKRLPFAKQFLGVIDAETDRLTGYQRLEDTEKLVDPIKRAMAAGDGAQAREMRRAAGPVAGLGDAVQQTRRDLSAIVKTERKTIDSNELTDAAKYVKLMELAERRRQVLQRFNKAYDRAVLATERQEKEAAK